MQIGRGAARPGYGDDGGGHTRYDAAANKLYVYRLASVYVLMAWLGAVEDRHGKLPSALVMSPETLKRLRDSTRYGLARTVSTPRPGMPVGRFMGVDIEVETI